MKTQKVKVTSASTPPELREFDDAFNRFSLAVNDLSNMLSVLRNHRADLMNRVDSEYLRNDGVGDQKATEKLTDTIVNDIKAIYKMSRDIEKMTKQAEKDKSQYKALR